MNAPDFDRLTVRMGMIIPIFSILYILASSIWGPVQWLFDLFVPIETVLAGIAPGFAKTSAVLALHSAPPEDIVVARHLLAVALVASAATLILQLLRAPFSMIDIIGLRRRASASFSSHGSLALATVCGLILFVASQIILILLGFAPPFSSAYQFMGLLAVVPIFSAPVWGVFIGGLSLTCFIKIGMSRAKFGRSESQRL